MGLLGKLFGEKDPTAAWMAFERMPEFDARDMKLGTLRFGEGYAGAQFLGKPNEVEWGKEMCSFIYYAAGVELVFRKGEFEEIYYYIGPDEYRPVRKGLVLCKAHVREAGAAVVLDRSMDREKVERIFGNSEEVTEDEDEVVVKYERGGNIVDFAFNLASGELKQFAVYRK